MSRRKPKVFGSLVSLGDVEWRQLLLLSFEKDASLGQDVAIYRTVAPMRIKRMILTRETAAGDFFFRVKVWLPSSVQYFSNYIGAASAPAANEALDMPLSAANKARTIPVGSWIEAEWAFAAGGEWNHCSLTLEVERLDTE